MFHPRLREAFGMCVKKMSVEWTQKKKEKKQNIIKLQQQQQHPFPKQAI